MGIIIFNIPSITQNKVSPFRIRSKASECTPSPLFCAPMHLCTHALHEMARERGDLISSGMILFSVVGGTITSFCMKMTNLILNGQSFGLCVPCYSLSHSLFLPPFSPFFSVLHAWIAHLTPPC